MRKKNIKKTLPIALLAILAIILLSSLLFYVVNNYSHIQGNKNVNNSITLDRPDYYPLDSAIPYLTMKWLNNIKFAKIGILKQANIQTINEGNIFRVSFDKGEINVDKQAKINYPFVARIELESPINKKRETLYFSAIRYEKAKIYRIYKDGSIKRSNWKEMKIGDKARIEESIDLLISNIDNNNKFTDKYLKNLIIHLE